MIYTKEKQSKKAFVKCKDACVCYKKVCDPITLKQCPACQNVQKSHCGKVSCQNKNGKIRGYGKNSFSFSPFNFHKLLTFSFNPFPDWCKI